MSDAEVLQRALERALGKKAKLEDFQAENAENAKPIVEGEYDQKKDD